MQLFQITAKNFCAGFEYSNRVERIAPIIYYMKRDNWCIDRIVYYCGSMGWKIEEVPDFVLHAKKDFIDNQAIAIRRTGKIIIDLIPKIYGK